MIRYPVGVSVFKKLVSEDYIFVDKTLFLKDFIEDGAQVTLIARPRRFGKTLTLSMCDEFFSITNAGKDNIFQNLQITEYQEICQKHQNKYPVIFISLKDVKETEMAISLSKIKTILSELYARYRFLMEENFLHEEEKIFFQSVINEQVSDVSAQKAIKYLARILKRRYNQAPIILIDEYDTPIQAAYLSNYYDKMIEFMRGFFGATLKETGQSNELHFHKALVTGISRIAQESLFSDLNNFKAYTMLDRKYGQFFGFIEDEVASMLEKTKLDVKLEDIKSWYNGYNIGGHIIYNAWSIINCLADGGILQSYWVGTSTNALACLYIDQADEKFGVDIDNLINGDSLEIKLDSNLVFPDLSKKINAIWALLIHTGCLNVLEYNPSKKIAKVAVPNKEVMEIYQNSFKARFIDNYGDVRYDKLYESLAKGNFEKFKEALIFYLNTTVSYFDFNVKTPERVFHSFMLGILVGLVDDYKVVSNKESGKGRLDIAIIPKDPSKSGICLEFKVSDSKENMALKASEALQQIKDKNYIQMFKDNGVKEVQGLGLSFYGKEVEMVNEKLLG